MSITSKHYLDRFFEKDKENESYFNCKNPGCTVKRKRPAGTGFGNIIQQLQSAHPTYISDYQANNSASTKLQVGSTDLTGEETVSLKT